jgi:alpha-L-rhamnosidase
MESEGTYGNAGGNIFALKMGVPANQYDRVVKALKEDIKANKGHLDTGIFGTQFFFEVLADNGMQDLAYEAMNKKEEPGYGHWIELRSTTSREQWSVEGSHNHPMFGGGLTWLYRKLAGMQADPENPGYRNIIFRPMPAGDIKWVKFYNITPNGKAGISWELRDGKMMVNLTVPAGSQASIHLPLMKAKRVFENGMEISPSFGTQLAKTGIEYKSDENNCRIIKVRSGEYHFVSE